jgi:hypothetical protein
MEKYLLQHFFESMGFQVVYEDSEQAADPVKAEFPKVDSLPSSQKSLSLTKI